MTPNEEHKKISTSTQLREILYTDFQNMLVLSSTVASCYYSCCTDGKPAQEIMSRPYSPFGGYFSAIGICSLCCLCMGYTESNIP
jgi:hypothetical protein